MAQWLMSRFFAVCCGVWRCFAVLRSPDQERNGAFMPYVLTAPWFSFKVHRGDLMFVLQPYVEDSAGASGRRLGRNSNAFFHHASSFRKNSGGVLGEDELSNVGQSVDTELDDMEGMDEMGNYTKVAAMHARARRNWRQSVNAISFASTQLSLWWRRRARAGATDGRTKAGAKRSGGWSEGRREQPRGGTRGGREVSSNGRQGATE